MNKILLKSKMVIKQDTNLTLAHAIGISPQRLSAKINETNGAEFTLKEMDKIRKRYNLNGQEIESIFLFKKCLYTTLLITTERRIYRHGKDEKSRSSF